tara:strand:+ start:200749 stop:201111 length:363 start_codon:yes stop_codon:yes gene_type:complete
MSKFIFVDDDPNILEVYKDEIEIGIGDIDAHFFESALDAKEFIEDNDDIKLIVTDGKMPELDGYELGKLAKEKDPNIKVIMISGHFNLEDTEKEGTKVLDHFLEKPIDFDDFIQLLKSNT